MYIVGLIKLSSREGNIAILVSNKIAVASNMFSVFSIGCRNQIASASLEFMITALTEHTY